MKRLSRRATDNLQNLSDHDLLTIHTVNIASLKESIEKIDCKIDDISNKIESYAAKKLDISFFKWISGIVVIFIIFIGGVYISDRSQISDNVKNIAVNSQAIKRAEKNAK